jgi:hypothetical protein
MHQSLIAIQQHLSQVIAQLRLLVPNDEPFGNAHNNWSFPGLTRVELIEEVQSIIDLIEDQGSDDVGDHDARLNDMSAAFNIFSNTRLHSFGATRGRLSPLFCSLWEAFAKHLPLSLSETDMRKRL